MIVAALQNAEAAAIRLHGAASRVGTCVHAARPLRQSSIAAISLVLRRPGPCKPLEQASRRSALPPTRATTAATHCNDAGHSHSQGAAGSSAPQRWGRRAAGSGGAAACSALPRCCACGSSRLGSAAERPTSPAVPGRGGIRGRAAAAGHPAGPTGDGAAGAGGLHAGVGGGPAAAASGAAAAAHRRHRPG